MIISNVQFNEFTLNATDGTIGKVKDLFIDDESWATRFLVVETGSWIKRHRVLIPTAALGSIDAAGKAIEVSITREQVQNSPDIDCAMPVSRQHETDLSGYYGFPTYHESATRADADPHLRSVQALHSYLVRSDSEEIGHVSQFLISDEDWRAVAVIVKTGTWWHGDLIRLGSDCIVSVDWETKSLEVSASCEKLQSEEEYKV